MQASPSPCKAAATYLSLGSPTALLRNGTQKRICQARRAKERQDSGQSETTEQTEALEQLSKAPAVRCTVHSTRTMEQPYSTRTMAYYGSKNVLYVYCLGNVLWSVLCARATVRVSWRTMDAQGAYCTTERPLAWHASHAEVVSEVHTRCFS